MQTTTKFCLSETGLAVRPKPRTTSPVLGSDPSSDHWNCTTVQHSLGIDNPTDYLKFGDLRGNVRCSS